MSNPTIAKRLDALEARTDASQQRIVVSECGCNLFLLDQPHDESEEAFRDRVRALWLKGGSNPAQMPKFNWGTTEEATCHSSQV